MNGNKEKGLIAVAVAFLLIISAMSLMQMLPTDDDAEEGGKILSGYADSKAYDTILSSNYEPEDMQDYMDEDGDGEPEIDGGEIEAVEDLDPEEILDEDGDGEPDYDEIAGPDTPLGTATNATETSDILDYEIEDIEDMLDQDNDTLEGEAVVDPDAEAAAEYDPEEDADDYDDTVIDTDDIEEYEVLWGEGEFADATADPEDEEHDERLGLEDFEIDLVEYDDEEFDNSTLDATSAWERDLWWTYDTVDADEDGFPEHTYAILFIQWSYDGDDDGNPEFVWSFLAGYDGYDNDSDNRSNYDAVLIVVMRTWDVDDDGTPDRVRERNWGRVRIDDNENGVAEETLVFAAYREVDGEANRTVKVIRWAHYVVNSDEDQWTEEDTRILVSKELTFENGALKHRKKAVWMLQQLNEDDDNAIELSRAVVIGFQYYDNDTDGNPEYTASALGGVEDVFEGNHSRRVLLMATEGFDLNDDGIQNSNKSFVFWSQVDMVDFEGDVIYGRGGVVGVEYYDNNSDGNAEWRRTVAGFVEYWDANANGVQERNRTALAAEVFEDDDDDGNVDLEQRAVWYYEVSSPDGGAYAHVQAAVAAESFHDNDSDGKWDFYGAAAGGYESWDNDTDGTPEYEALVLAVNHTWYNGTEGESGYVRTVFAVMILDNDQDGVIEHGLVFLSADLAEDENDDGYIDHAWGVRGAHERQDPDDDGNVNYMANFLGVYDFQVKTTEEYEEASETEEADSEVDDIMDSDDDGEPDQDQGTISAFVDEELQEEIGDMMDSDDDETADFAELEGDSPIEGLSEGGDSLLDYTPLNVTDVNEGLQNESSGEPEGDAMWNETTKQSYGMDDNLTRVEQPGIDYEDGVVLIDNLSLENKILWWDGEGDPTADEEWIEGGMMAFGQQLYDNDTNGVAETQTYFSYQISLGGIVDENTSQHRKAAIAYSWQNDKDQDGHYEDTVGAIGFLETYDNNTDGHDEYQAAIWIAIDQRNVSVAGNPQHNETTIFGLEQEFTDSTVNPVHARAVIGHAVATDADTDGNYEYVKGEAVAMEMYDNDTDGNASYIGVVVFGTEAWDSDDDGFNEVEITYIWILEASDDDNDGNHERLWAVITHFNKYDNNSDGEQDEAQAMQAGCLKVDEDDDGNVNHLKLYVAGGGETDEGTEWFVWYREGTDVDDDGEFDEMTSFALYMKNHTDQQTIVNAVHILDEDSELVYFGVADTTDEDRDGNNEHEAAGNWILETEGGVSRGGLFYMEKNDTDDDGNPESEVMIIIGFESVDEDMDGTPESQTLLIIHNQKYDNNSNGHFEHTIGAAIGAHVEGNGTNPEHGYLYIVYGEAFDEQDDGTESNSTIVIAGYMFYDNDTDGQKDYEVVKGFHNTWNDVNGDGVKDGPGQEGEQDYNFFGAEVSRD